MLNINFCNKTFVNKIKKCFQLYNKILFTMLYYENKKINTR